MPNTDIRVQVTFPSHWKTRKLERLIGDAGPKCLVYLWCYAGANKPKGVFTKMSDPQIEDAAYWEGESGKFIDALVQSGYLEGKEGSRTLHDWAEHNEWCHGFPERSERNRQNRLRLVKDSSASVKERKRTSKVRKGKVGKGEERKGEGNVAVAKWVDLMREYRDKTYDPPGADCKACKEALEHVKGDIKEFERRALNCMKEEWFQEKQLSAGYFLKNIEKFKGETSGTHADDPGNYDAINPATGKSYLSESGGA